MKLNKLTLIVVSLMAFTLWAATPTITFVSSPRGVGVMLQSVPSDLQLSTRRSGNLLLLSLVSDKLRSYSPQSFNAVIKNHDVSQIAARIKENRLEIVFSMDNPSKYQDISYKSTGDGKGMILLSRSKNIPVEVTLVAEGGSKKSASTTSQPKKSTPKKSPVAKKAPVAKAPVAKTESPKKQEKKPATPQKVVPQKHVDAPTPQTSSPSPTGTVLFLTKDNVHIRRTPSTQNKENVVGSFPLGTRFISNEKRGSWYNVTLDDGSTAWVHESIAQDSNSITADVWDAIYNKRKKSDSGYRVAKKEPKKSTPQESTPKEQQTPKKSTPVEGAFSLDDTPVEEVTSEEIKDLKESTQKVDEKIIQTTTVVYHPTGRDPFIPLDSKSNVYVDESIPEVANITLVGILYDEQNGIGLFEETKGKNKGTSFTLQKGDAVVGGKVLQVFPDKVVFLMQEFDYSYTVEKVLKSQKE